MTSMSCNESSLGGARHKAVATPMNYQTRVRPLGSCFMLPLLSGALAGKGEADARPAEAGFDPVVVGRP